MKKILFFLSLFFITHEAYCQVIDSSFFNWTVYEMQEDQLLEKKCYIVSRPIKSDSDHNTRLKPYIIITRYQNRRIEEIAINSGFEYRENSYVLLAMDDDKFNLVTNNDMAWARDKKEDALLIQKILDSSIIKVRADSAFATYAIDEYSSKGVAKAYARMKEICQ